MKIAIVVALSSELDFVKNIFDSLLEVEEKNISFLRGKIAENEVVLMKCGIGKVNAAVRLSELINLFMPDLVINTGVAGGINASLSVGDVVVGEQTCYHDVWCGQDSWGQVQGLPLYFNGSSKIINMIKDMSIENIHFGLICTGDQFITEKIGLQNIQHNFPKALAVDMESAAMAHICYQREVPFTAIRIISDTPNKDIDNHTQYFDFWETAPRRSFDILQKVLHKL